MGVKIKSKASNQFGYQGYGRITFTNKGKKFSVVIHNKATKNLGDLISIALCGDLRNIDSISRRVPCYIGFEAIIDEGKSTEQVRSLLVSPATITSKVWGPAVNDFESDIQNSLDVIGKSQFTAVIPSNYVIRGFTLGGALVPRLKLTNSIGQDLAYIYDDPNSNAKQLPLLYNALMQGQDALVDWVMYILNAVVE